MNPCHGKLQLFGFSEVKTRYNATSKSGQKRLREVNKDCTLKQIEQNILSVRLEMDIYEKWSLEFSASIDKWNGKEANGKMFYCLKKITKPEKRYGYFFLLAI